ncbi:hypothetical protein AB205_0061180 [Aquarana catesbeiana]|uniref:Uncharacterized protein n=1 Tax=Aquarana catesbeiana TaxID=8400 RepID=A0A2G9SA51_AQUCT|nr:hypothetical protein AB205_0061180 [Aquarana catesbeiana]
MSPLGDCSFYLTEWLACANVLGCMTSTALTLLMARKAVKKRSKSNINIVCMLLGNGCIIPVMRSVHSPRQYRYLIFSPEAQSHPCSGIIQGQQLPSLVCHFKDDIIM